MVISSIQFLLMFLLYGISTNSWNNGNRPVLTEGVCLTKCENQNFVNNGYFSWLYWDFMFAGIICLLLNKRIKLSSYNDNYIKDLLGCCNGFKRILMFLLCLLPGAGAFFVVRISKKKMNEVLLSFIVITGYLLTAVMIFWF